MNQEIEIDPLWLAIGASLASLAAIFLGFCG
jgi:hypothetical protein